MISKLSSLALLATFALLAGCSAGVGEDEGSSSDEIVARPASVDPGSFRLFAEPQHVTDPECESFTDLELKANGQARLVNGLGGKCALVALIDPNERGYTLRAVAGGSCGTQIFEGSRRVALGPATTGLATIKITDNRKNVCAVNASRIVVEETGAAIMYSADGVAPSEQAKFSCRENVDHGAEVTFFAQGGTITRAEYTETTIVDTKVVSNMNVCVSHAPTQHYPDAMNLTASCNDVVWVGGFAVELYEGGFAGIPSVKLYRIEGNGGEKTLVHSLMCRHEN